MRFCHLWSCCTAGERKRKAGKLNPSTQQYIYYVKLPELSTRVHLDPYSALHRTAAWPVLRRLYNNMYGRLSSSLFSDDWLLLFFPRCETAWAPINILIKFYFIPLIILNANPSTSSAGLVRVSGIINPVPRNTRVFNNDNYTSRCHVVSRLSTRFPRKTAWKLRNNASSCHEDKLSYFSDRSGVAIILYA